MVITSPGGETLQLGTTSSDDEDGTRAPGWSIGNALEFKNSLDQLNPLSSSRAIRMVINGGGNGIRVPSAPTALSAVAGGDTSIDLSWTASDSNGGSAVIGHRIEVSADAGETWSDLEVDTGTATTTYSHTGLPAFTTRRYRVSAINPAGPSAPSNSSAATTDPYTLVTNTRQGSDSSHPYAGDRSQRFSTGSHTAGYILSSLEIVSDDPHRDDFTAAVYTVNGSGDPDTLLAELTAPSSFTPLTAVFTAPDGTTLDASTTYAVLITSTGNDILTLDCTTSDAEDGSGAPDWGIQDAVDAKNSLNQWNPVGNSCALRITIKGVPVGVVRPPPPSGLSAARNGQNAIDLAWNAPASNGGGPITGYRIESSPDGVSW